jgi:hypothetical protein
MFEEVTTLHINRNRALASLAMKDKEIEEREKEGDDEG